MTAVAGALQSRLAPRASAAAPPPPRVRVVPAGDAMSGWQILQVSGMVLGLALLVLLAACANLANMLYARGANRAAEMAVRLSLGANRVHLVRLVFAEVGIIAALGATLALASRSPSRASSQTPFPICSQDGTAGSRSISRPTCASWRSRSSPARSLPPRRRGHSLARRTGAAPADARRIRRARRHDGARPPPPRGARHCAGDGGRDSRDGRRLRLGEPAPDARPRGQLRPPRALRRRTALDGQGRPQVPRLRRSARPRVPATRHRRVAADQRHRARRARRRPARRLYSRRAAHVILQNAGHRARPRRLSEHGAAGQRDDGARVSGLPGDDRTRVGSRPRFRA